MSKRRLKSIFTDQDLFIDLLNSSTDEEFAELGFICYKQLCETEYSFVHERIWVLYKETGEDEIYIIAIGDQGNGYSEMVLNDIPVQELLK